MMTKFLDKIRVPGIKNDSRKTIKSFAEEQKKEDAFSRRDHGVQSAPLAQIKGSVGRYRDFDSQFRLFKGRPSERLQNIRKLMRQGKLLPPVKLYQIKNEFFVLDGNHRVAAAKEIGYESIDAHILEFLPSRNSLENIIYREKVKFRDKTGLPDFIEVTKVGKYGYLLQQIVEHRKHLEVSEGEVYSFEKAAQDWYQTIYTPLALIIENSHLTRAFPQRTVADFYTYITYHHWEEGYERKYGIGVDQLIPTNMEAFRTKMADKKDIEMPEMKRGITAFILITVKVGHEYRIMEKMFKMEAVREIHYVHGEFDLIAKIVMQRDLLDSDSALIGEFVHQRIRSISAVTRTQTIIPVHSKQKKAD